MKRIIGICLVLLLVLGLFTACGKKEAQTTRVTLSEVTHSVFYAPQYAALSQGFFAEEGLEVELVNGGGADKVMTSVLTGDADIGLAGPEACIYVHLEGRENAPRIFAQLTARDGSFLVGREPEVFSWENLRGKTVIGGRKGGMPEMTLEYVMKQNGVQPRQDTEVDTSIQFNMMAGAFSSGTGDYVALFEPTATELELAGQGHVLCSIGEESGEIPYTAYFAPERLLQERPEVIQRFTNAVARGQKWVQNHTDAEVAAAIGGFFPDTDPEVLERVSRRYRSIGAWNTVPTMKEDALERLMDVMEEAGELDRRVLFTDLVDNSFAERANP